MKYSEEQLRAIRHTRGPAMVLAGPGSGKTTVITERLAALIRSGAADPSEILVLTFTRAAAEEMEQRYRRRRGACPGEGEERNGRISFGTFHSVFFSILCRRLGLSAENIISMGEQRELLRESMEAIGRELPEEPEQYRALLSAISRRKTRPENRAEDSRISAALFLSPEEFRRLCGIYAERMREKRRLDFDDMLLLTLSLFRSAPEELQRCRERWKYILVDEFQDSSPLQYELVRLLAHPLNNLFIVGDDDQSIYGFRGASPGLMLRFEKDYPGAVRILLPDNFRSGAALLRFSTNLISHNKVRFPKQLSAAAEGGRACKYTLPNTAREYELVAELLKRELASGIPGRELAVLYRTNAAVRPLLPELFRRQVPFFMKDRADSCFEHPVAQDLLAYLRLSIGAGSRGDLLRILNKPCRGLSRVSVQGRSVDLQALFAYYRERPRELQALRRLEEALQTLRSLPSAAALVYIRKRLGYEEALRSLYREKGRNTEELENIFGELSDSALRHPDKESWLRYGEEYTERLRALQRKGLQNGGGDGAVRLMTYHGAKGLEFHTVHLIDVVEGMVPYRRAATEEELEEERRSFYVALTRAKQEIHIYVTKERYSKESFPSRFLSEGERIQKQVWKSCAYW